MSTAETAARAAPERRPGAGERPLTVLSAAYPLAPVSMDSAGGAEQLGQRALVIEHAAGEPRGRHAHD